MRPRPRQVWGAGVVVAALGLLALVALASEEAPFDVEDDTGTVHGPSWVSIVLLAVIVMMIAFAVLLALSARTVADGTLRVRRRRSMIQMLVLAALAFLALLLIHALWHRQAEARPAGSDTRHPGREPLRREPSAIRVLRGLRSRSVAPCSWCWPRPP